MHGNWNGSHGNWICSHGLRSGSCVADAARHKWKTDVGKRVEWGSRMKWWVTEWWASGMDRRLSTGAWSVIYGPKSPAVSLMSGDCGNGLLWEFIRRAMSGHYVFSFHRWMNVRENEEVNGRTNDRVKEWRNGRMCIRYREWVPYWWVVTNHNEGLCTQRQLEFISFQSLICAHLKTHAFRWEKDLYIGILATDILPGHMQLMQRQGGT